MPKRVNPFVAEPDEHADADAQKLTIGDQVWGRQPNEPNLWYARFDKYRLQGTRRSMYAVYLGEPAKPGSKRADRADPRPRGGVPSSWLKQAAAWRWDERAEAWDQYERELDAIALAEQRAKLRQAEWEAFTALSSKAAEMMVYALATRTTENRASADGKMITTTIIKPVRWSMGDAARLFKAASEIGRLATGMATSIEEHREAPATNGDALSDQELDAIARLGAKDVHPGTSEHGDANDATDNATTDARASGSDITGAA